MRVKKKRPATILALAIVSLVPPLAMAQGNGPHRFTVAELQEIAQRTTKVEEEYEAMMSATRESHHWARSPQATNESMSEIYRYYLDSASISCVEIDAQNYWRDNFVVFRSEGPSMPPYVRVMAFGYDGSAFLLDGFARQDINALIEYMIGPIENDSMAASVSYFLIHDIEWQGYKGPEIVDKTNLHQYAKTFSNVRPVEITTNGTGYTVRLYVVELAQERLSYWTIQLARNAVIDISHTTIQSSDK